MVLGRGKAKSRKTPTLHFGPEPAYVVLKSEKASVSLRELVETRCRSLASKFRPVWWLFNGHLQTIYAILGDFTKIDQVWYQRRLLRLLDGGTLGLDFAPVEASSVPDDAPIIVVQHGLTGGSHEPYVRAILAPACAPVEQGGLGYRAVVVNFRGCSGVPITSPKFYTAAQTDDLRQALTFISKLYPNAPLLGLGFSIGGNVMLRYLAEEGVNSRLCSACVLGCPWDLVTNNEHLLNTTLGRHLYLRGMGDNVMTLMRHHSQAFLANPDHPAAKVVPTVLRLKKPTLTDFDDLFTCNVGDTPPFPFPSVRDYYTWASSHEVAEQIRVPCLTINSADDPVVHRVQMPSGRNGYIVTVLTATGGHLGWYRSRRKRWTTKPVLEWMELVGRDILREPIEISSYTDESGYLREPQWPKLGCKEVPGGGLIDGNRPESALFQGL
ncbi:Alpha/Beta hydrolase protein [Mycena maculata]|uniref:Alpha/Beta hydrolase protein n=1 Tax=Mycena maculata TaxID=230809 RepID=A0AAD7J5C0_9AGAR|nr:Alpha/Beta hydrolase protein [Mycena maculata]